MERVTLADLRYLERLHPRLDAVLARIDREGGREGVPVVGTAVGRLLRVLVAATAARRVLEVGTAIGYSALWMGGVLPATGELVTIDPDRERTERAKRSWRAARLRARLVVHNGPALDVLPTLVGPFDVLFIDAVKEEYQGDLDLGLPLVRRGGLVAVDNLLWGGRASGSVPSRDSSTRAIRAFNKRFLSDRRLAATIVPVGDGVGLAVKR